MKHITLAEARDSAGLTQQQLEERSGVDRSRISRLEKDPNANPTIETVRKLEAALSLKPGTLRFGVELQAAQ